MNWPKICSCRQQIFAGEWTMLPFVGYQVFDDIPERFELRNCRCGTTLAIEVEPAGLPYTLTADLADVVRNEAREIGGYPQPYAWPPQERRKVSDEDERESARLYEIADELSVRVDAWVNRESDEEAA